MRAQRRGEEKARAKEVRVSFRVGFRASIARCGVGKIVDGP